MMGSTILLGTGFESSRENVLIKKICVIGVIGYIAGFHPAVESSILSSRTKQTPSKDDLCRSKRLNFDV